MTLLDVRSAGRTDLAAPDIAGQLIEGAVDIREDGIPVDKWKRPLVPNPLNPGHTLPCMRPSSIGKKFLTESYAIDAWRKRVILTGAARTVDIIEQAAPLDVKADKAVLDRLVDEAYKAGGGETNANRGTARHSWLELILTGRLDETQVPSNIAADVEAIRRCLDEHGVRLVDDWSEQFVICPELPAAGSPDAYVTSHLGAGTMVLDLKTGEKDPRGYSSPLEHALQLATYARAAWSWPGPYTDAAGQLRAHPLRPTPADMNLDVGLILWAPLDTGRAEIIGIDLAEGWRMLELALRVRDEGRRNERRFVVPLTTHAPVGNAVGFETSTLAQRIVACRRRLADVVKLTSLTRSCVGDMWPAGVPSLKTPSFHTDDTVTAVEGWVDELEDDLGLQVADPAEVAAWAARIDALPTDLLAEVTSSAQAAGVPNLRSRGVRRRHLEALEPHVVEATSEALDRKAATHKVLDDLPDDAQGSAAAIVVRLATEDRGVQSLFELTALEHRFVYAIATAVLAEADLSTAGLESFFGGKRKAIDAARPVAERFGVKAPRSCGALAADSRLAALVWLDHVDVADVIQFPQTSSEEE